MSDPDLFEQPEPEATPPGGVLHLDLEGYEGPIDLLLDLARDQKVDLTRISILALADQYLAFVQQARKLRLELAADYLVMAAWLAYLKSRLLLPDNEDKEEPSGAEMAAALRFQLQRLEAMRNAGERLMARPRLGHEFYPRGEAQPLAVVTTPTYQASLYDLLRAYARNAVRVEAANLTIAQLNYYAVEDALVRLRGLVGEIPNWRSIFACLPAELQDEDMRRSALASTFAASLELAREGEIQIRQDGTFGPIYLRGVAESS